MVSFPLEHRLANFYKGLDSKHLGFCGLRSSNCGYYGGTNENFTRLRKFCAKTCIGLLKKTTLWRSGFQS